MNSKGILNIEDRKWVEAALAHWVNCKASRKVSQRLIDWNVVQLSAALDRIEAEEKKSA